MSTQNPVITVQTAEERDRDLGFGSVVSQQRHLRLLNRDGTFNISRQQTFLDSISYYSLIMMSWPRFFGLVIGSYVAANALFAGLYLLCGANALQTTSGHETTPFLRAFFFSIETFSTIGYGNIVPTTLAANIIVSVEAVTALLGFALATGILFARFSRPTARILFSNVAIVAPYNTINAFEFRIINARNSQIIELGARVLLAKFETVDGYRIRKYHQLQLEREKVVFFPLSWTIVHPIDQKSPMWGLTPEDLIASDAEFLILLTGIDETFSQTVHARSSYRAEEIVWGAKFANVYIYDEHGHILGVDMERFHAIERAAAA
ncbi:MAG TPA: ion channel [Terriglobales bacterium]|nr:ion channel [Terriglobales bacterium]